MQIRDIASSCFGAALGSETRLVDIGIDRNVTQITHGELYFPIILAYRSTCCPLSDTSVSCVISDLVICILKPQVSVADAQLLPRRNVAKSGVNDAGIGDIAFPANVLVWARVVEETAKSEGQCLLSGR